MNPPEQRFRESEELRAILKRVLASDKIPQQAKLVDVEEVWNAELGDLAELTRVRSLRGGVLHVAVASPAALYEIRSFKEETVLARFREALPRRQVRRLKLTMMPLPPEAEELG